MLLSSQANKQPVEQSLVLISNTAEVVMVVVMVVVVVVVSDFIVMGRKKLIRSLLEVDSK